ncbi:class I SAM-dependent methyltransferase [Candidatus Bathyarchaeota archaeon]|jgi:ubiquinone/menaquinone biosynthesis C-methylase UbiE|nr:class I SAM-dependent methyltransferase [Candidatus Bathyarchaeota archaeon]MBT4320670.1 class I SAM-dependent methyltransferase [Candidatus Bathyarchaeota archaeon]MBT4423724.1 class I SAM-dependent methyltransferase [Candidatus Bathyarchaeota archaeon]MBT5642551.1 class I SAM-dependent methyltransferase [Candidatus Bathyarchaeota archaeon]MBT6604686.1 class I SAM-dependent methyltransferase [Candidatus Bathyarchaeota archaeon]
MSQPDKSRVKARYDELGGKLYNVRYMEEQTAKYEHILAYLGRGKTLDNGCGTGLFLPFLDQYSVGLDISSKLLKEAREKAGNRALVQGDSENLPFRAAVFDNMVSITVIQNLPSSNKLVAESSRVVTQNGTLVISSLKRVYSEDEFSNLVETGGLTVNIVNDIENINDWIAVIRNTR